MIRACCAECAAKDASGPVPMTPSDAHPGLPSPSALKAGRMGEMSTLAGRLGGVKLSRPGG
jgi:hypothetical protein